MTTSLDDRPRFAALTALVSDRSATEALGAWDIGEQEGAIAGLVDALLQEHTPITDRNRGQLAVLAETWGVWEALADRIADCRPAHEEDAHWRLTGVDQAEAIRTQLTREIAPGHVLHTHEPVAWMVCTSCPEVLVRVYAREPWGVVPIALQYAVVRATWAQGQQTPPYPATRVFAAAYDALDHLDDCQRRPSEPRCGQ